MTTLTFDKLAYLEKLKASGIPEAQARAHAVALDEALRELRASEPLVELLGPTFVEAFALVKEAEYEVFLQVISSWEREHLLLNV